MNAIRDELRQECEYCGGSGSRFFDSKLIPCKACEGTGKSSEWRELEKDFASVFTCAKCGAHKVHYRLHGYQCPNRCKED